jgi:hypothetical protein
VTSSSWQSNDALNAQAAANPAIATLSFLFMPPLRFFDKARARVDLLFSFLVRHLSAHALDPGEKLNVLSCSQLREKAFVLETDTNFLANISHFLSNVLSGNLCMTLSWLEHTCWHTDDSGLSCVSRTRRLSFVNSDTFMKQRSDWTACDTHQRHCDQAKPLIWLLKTSMLKPSTAVLSPNVLRKLRISMPLPCFI